MKRVIITFIAVGCFMLEASASSLPEGFVYLHHIDPTIEQKLEGATAHNIIGVPIDGYEGNQVICTQELAFALSQIQKELTSQGLSLLVLDAYRPSRAVEHAKKWAKDLSDQKTKANYYPDIDKADILGTYLAANRSSHSRGSTVDILIIDAETNVPLDFGPQYFGEVSGTYAKNISPTQSENRLRLRELMLSHNFKPYDAEFWHFTLINEPFPDTYFDFSVRNSTE